MLWKADLGGATLFAIEDGWGIRDPHDWFVGTTPEDWELRSEHLNDQGMLPTTFGCFLFDDGKRLVMIDTGFGVNAPEVPGGEAGHMPDALERLGVSPTDVDAVIHTHLHPDHILGGLDREQNPFFPNAVYHSHVREVSYWRSGIDQIAGTVSSVLDSLEAAGALGTVDTAGELFPGISLVETFGHTPGHTSVLLGGDERQVMISGDVTYNPVHCAHPDWSIRLDVDPGQATATRIRFFADLAGSGTPMAAGHYPRPGFGRIVSLNGAWRFEPLPVEILG